MAEDALNYKIEFQAALNAAPALAGLHALQDRLDSLIGTQQISQEAFNAIDAVLANYEQRLAGANIEELKLNVSALAVSNEMKRQATALKEATAATAAKAAENKKLAESEAAAAAAAEKAAAAQVAAQQKATEAAQRAQAAIGEQNLRADTLASRTGFNANQSGRSSLNSALGSTALAYVSPTSKEAVSVNEQIAASRQKLIALESQYESKIKLTTDAFKAEVQASNAGGALTGAEMAARQEALRQKVVETTAAYEQQRKAIVDASAAQKAMAGYSGSAQTLGGSLGSFYPLIVAQRIAQDTARITLGLGAAAVKTAADYQAAFANVERTMNTVGPNAAGQIEYIRQALMKLDTQVPLTFDQLSQIAHAGNELGIGANAIISFTKNVAMYSTVAGTTIQNASTALGSIAQLFKLNTSQDITSLGSALEYTGRISVATEAQVQAMVTKLAGISSSMGLSAQYTIGLSAALASIQEPAERSQGALTTFTKVLDTAVASGNKNLTGFAHVIGETTAQTAQLVKTDPNAFLTKFVEGLSKMDGITKTNTLMNMGLGAQRVLEVFSRLSDHASLLTQLVGASNQAFAKGTDLASQYAIKTATLAAKYVELQNAVKNLMADIGSGGLAKELSVIVDALKTAAVAIDGFVKKNPQLANSIVVFFGLVGAVMALRAAMIGVEIAGKAFGTLGYGAAEVTTFRGSLTAVIAALFGFKTATAAATTTSAAEMAAMATEAEISAARISGAFAGNLAPAELAAIGDAAIIGGEGMVAGGDLAKVGGAAFFTAEGLASAGITVLLAGIATLIGWLVTDFPGAMKWAAGAVGWLADGFMNAYNAIGPIIGGIIAEIDLLLGALIKLYATSAQVFSFVASGGGLWSGTGFSQNLQKNADGANKLSDALLNLGGNANKVQKQVGSGALQFKSIADQMQQWADSLKSTDPKAVAPDNAAYLAELKKLEGQMGKTGAAGTPLANGIGKGGNAAAKAAQQVHTLVDYASELQGVMTRATDIQFGPMLAKDAITTSWQTMKTNALQAAGAVQTARDKVNQLQADIAKAKADNVQQQYFLSVAQQFGDTLRMPTIQASVNTNNATVGNDQTQLVTANTDLANAQDKASKSLTGNSAGAIANRQALTDLIKKDQDYIDKLAASGASQETLRKTTEKLKKEFIAQATQLGFNKKDVENLATAFDGMVTIINKVPRNITVTANVNPALQALNEYAAKAQSTANSINKSLGGIGKGGGISLPPITDPTNPRVVEKASLDAELSAYTTLLDNAIAQGNAMSAVGHYAAVMGDIRSQLHAIGYAEGGFTGVGAKYEPAGVVHRGEYVVPQQYVNQATGLPYADAFGRLAGGTYTQGSGGYAAGGFVNTDMMVTELGPRSLGVLRQMVAKEMAVYLDGKAVTSSVNSNNRMDRFRGRGN